ncbi:MAG: hypothetical protein P4L98_21295 [Ancalomicrobiaceae bacterium]|nr:hypothetical protein [Ancalomicrobiaceae bacterium]
MADDDNRPEPTKSIRQARRPVSSALEPADIDPAGSAGDAPSGADAPPNSDAPGIPAAQTGNDAMKGAPADPPSPTATTPQSPPADEDEEDEPDPEDEPVPDWPEMVIAASSKTDPDRRPNPAGPDQPGAGKPDPRQSADLRVARSEFEGRLWDMVVARREAQTGQRTEEAQANAERDENIMANFVLLASALARKQNRDLYGAGIFGLQAFKSGYRQAAADIARELNYQTSTSAPLTEVMRGLARFMWIFLYVMLGFALCCLVFVVAAPLVGPKPAQPSQSLFQAGFGDLVDHLRGWAPILVAVIFGCAGSVVSILLRLAEFEKLTGRSREFILYTGTSLPFVGGIFAAVTAALFDSQIINLSAGLPAGGGSGLSLKLYIIIGFLAGFSERFTRNLLKIFEDKLAGQSPAPAGPAPSNVAETTVGK